MIAQDSYILTQKNSISHLFKILTQGKQTSWLAVQKPFNQLISTEISGPAAWKQLPTWYQISENDRLIPPDIQRRYADRMNATTLSLNSSHMSLVSQPEAIAEQIINATKESTNG